ncbi:hypothetical protein PAXINDRAFT_47630, partial [Paxillus involutus ATCC 200175]
LLTISRHETTVYHIIYLPGGRRLVTSSRNCTVRTWNVENCEEEGMRMEHVYRVWGLAVTRDGKRILNSSRDELLRVWDAETHQPIAEWAQKADIVFIASSPDDQLVASGDVEGRVVIREMKEGDRIKHAIETSHTDRVVTISLSPDETKLASVSLDGTVRFWATDSGDPIGEPLEHEGDANPVAFSPSGEFAACGGRIGKLSIW